MKIAKIAETGIILGSKCNPVKVAVGPKRSTNRNLKQIITMECTKNVIFQLLRHRHFKRMRLGFLYFFNPIPDSALLQIFFFITSVRDTAAPRNLVTFPKI